jgi:hypothetical protein
MGRKKVMGRHDLDDRRALTASASPDLRRNPFPAPPHRSDFNIGTATSGCGTRASASGHQTRSAFAPVNP